MPHFVIILCTFRVHYGTQRGHILFYKFSLINYYSLAKVRNQIGAGNGARCWRGVLEMAIAGWKFVPVSFARNGTEFLILNYNRIVVVRG